jgi:uncharacterized protein YjbJ (UPF0337 family)
MNKDQFGRKWHEIRGRVKAHWSRLTDNELEQVKGSSEILIGMIQEKYDEPRKAIEFQLDRFLEEPRQEAQKA